jgi:hypothetical protein
VALTGVYLLLRLSAFERGGVSVWIARAIALIGISIIPVFILNWPLVNKLRRAARLRRRLAPSLRRRLMYQFGARRRQRRLANLLTLVLSLMGAFVVLFALLGLVFAVFPEGSRINFPRLTLWAVATVFGLSCVFQHFMARGRERLEVIAELSATLLASRTGANGSQLADADYDEIIRIERAQISADRRQSVKAASRTPPADQYSSREHRAVRDAKLALPPATLVKVQECIDRLGLDPRVDDETGQAPDQVSYLRVPDTSLEIGFSVDWATHEIKILSLGPISHDGTSVGVRQEQGR